MFHPMGERGQSKPIKLWKSTFYNLPTLNLEPITLGKKKAFQLNQLNQLQQPEPLNLKLCLGGKNVLPV